MLQEWPGDTTWHTSNQSKSPALKKVLLLRFGGLGDLAPMTVVGKELKKRGWHVTLACRHGGEGQRQSDIFYQNPCFDQVLDMRAMGPWGDRCVKTQLGWCSVNNIFPDFHMVYDYMNIIENNNTSPMVKETPGEEWQRSRNSNWRNWYDLHLEWANVDPTKVAEADKRPLYTLLPGEEKVFEGLRKKHSHVFVVQTSSSSLSRTWYQSEKMIQELFVEYPEALVAYWDNEANKWLMITKAGVSQLNVPNHPPLRVSMALISVADVFIGADSGFTHIAEGLGIPQVAIYSTVPWWTRAKYYKHQTPIDPGQTNPEFYTFNLGLGDPLRVKEGLESLTEREKKLDELYKQKLSAKEASEALNTTVEGAEMELNALGIKRASWERCQSKALSSVTPEMVLEKVRDIVRKKD
jgi:hypothetical protein